MLEVESDVVAGDWPDDVDWQALCVEAVTAAVLGAGMTPHRALNVEISVRFTDDAEQRDLNREYRGKDAPTNVLSFPMYPAGEVAAALGAADGDILLGDISLAFETVAREAAEKRVGLRAHAAHLLVHGALHLLGHDHGDDAAAGGMEALETRILAGLGIADPYQERTDADG